MLHNNLTITLIINRLDKYHGRYRYYIGKNNIGTLEEFKDQKKIFFLMAPAFGNVGDEAIVESIVQFLTDMYSDYKLIVIDYHNTIQYLKEIRRIIREGDLIFLQGGGNIGTLYYDAEVTRELIIKKFHDVPIVSMPQSMFFENTKSGRLKLEKSKRIYNAHPNFTIIAREQYSYKAMKEAYKKCKVMINPDIVFYLSKKMEEQEVICKESSHELARDGAAKLTRRGIMACLRTDKEDILGQVRIDILNCLSADYNNLLISDTCVPRNISQEIRVAEVKSLIRLFASRELVITDRLHGMVLAALTNTPCIVMPSKDKKVLGTYEWIKDIGNIRFIDKPDVNIIEKEIDVLLSKPENAFDWGNFRRHYFDDLKERIGV